MKGTGCVLHEVQTKFLCLFQKTVGLLIFVVEEVVLVQVFLRVVPFSPVNIIPPTLHTHIHLKAKPGKLQTKQFFFGYRKP